MTFNSTVATLGLPLTTTQTVSISQATNAVIPLAVSHTSAIFQNLATFFQPNLPNNTGQGTYISIGKANGATLCGVIQWDYVAGISPLFKFGNFGAPFLSINTAGLVTAPSLTSTGALIAGTTLNVTGATTVNSTFTLVGTATTTLGGALVVGGAAIGTIAVSNTLSTYVNIVSALQPNIAVGQGNYLTVGSVATTFLSAVVQFNRVSSITPSLNTVSLGVFGTPYMTVDGLGNARILGTCIVTGLVYSAAKIVVSYPSAGSGYFICELFAPQNTGSLYRFFGRENTGYNCVVETFNYVSSGSTSNTYGVQVAGGTQMTLDGVGRLYTGGYFASRTIPYNGVYLTADYTVPNNSARNPFLTNGDNAGTIRQNAEGDALMQWDNSVAWFLNLSGRTLFMQVSWVVIWDQTGLLGRRSVSVLVESAGVPTIYGVEDVQTPASYWSQGSATIQVPAAAALYMNVYQSTGSGLTIRRLFNQILTLGTFPADTYLRLAILN